MAQINNNTFENGDYVTIVMGYMILKGRIYIASEDTFYILHNNNAYRNANYYITTDTSTSIPVWEGLPYSYALYRSQLNQFIVIHTIGKLIDEPVAIPDPWTDTDYRGAGYTNVINETVAAEAVEEEPKEKAKEEVKEVKRKEPELNIINLSIRDNIYGFLSTIDDQRVKYLLLLKLGVIDSYDSITSSKDQGYVELHSKERGKKLSIRLGRLMRKLVKAFNKLTSHNEKNKPLEVTDEVIETIHNKWMSSHPSAMVHKILTGQDLLEGYRRANYVKGGSSLQNSCMTDKFDLLKIYSENPDKISLMAFYAGDSICARCLLWTCDNGEKFYDRIYTGYDWLYNGIQEVLKTEGYKPLAEEAQVTLSRIDFDWYPYMDSFYNVHFKKKRLYYDPKHTVRTKYYLRSTGGYISQNGTFIEEE